MQRSRVASLSRSMIAAGVLTLLSMAPISWWRFLDFGGAGLGAEGWCVRSMYNYRPGGRLNCRGIMSVAHFPEAGRMVQTLCLIYLESRDETDAFHVHGMSDASRVRPR
jgi:hypothetical protein